MLTVFVEASGEVGEVRIQETSRDIAFDMEVARLFRNAPFLPAMIEGIGVPVWAEFPVSFTPRR